MPFAFGEFELDECLYQVRRGGEVLKVRRGAFEVLAYLLRHRDRVIPKDELLEKIWGQRYVSESSLAHCITALRSALGDEPSSPRVIQTVYGRGYRFVAPVEEVCGVEAPEPPPSDADEATQARPGPRPGTPEDAPLREVFVGRGRELRRLLAALDAADEGRVRLVVIAGEHGVGKTRLAERFADDARARGLRVLEGRCHEAEGAPPFWPWVQILRACLVTDEGRAARASLGVGAPEFAKLAPELLDASGAEPSVATERFMLFDAVTRFLRASAERRPLLLLIDDLHLADESSVSLLSFLARELRGARVSIAATYTDRGRAGERPVTRAICALTQETPVEVIRLAPFSQDEVADFLRAVTGRPAQPRQAARIHRKTDGNPLFVAEVARLLLDEAASGGAARSLAIPPELRATLARRLERLSPACRRLLGSASVMGREFHADLLGRVADGPAARCLELLQEALDAGVVAEAPSAEGVDAGGLYRFSHELIRDVLYEDLPVGRRVATHRRLGTALERRSACAPASRTAELAHHFFQSLDAKDLVKAARYSARAGSEAAERFAYEQAVVHYDRALTAHERLGSADVRRICDLLLAKARAQKWSHDFEGGSATLNEAIERARSAGSTRHLAGAALVWGCLDTFGTVDPAWTALTEAALCGLGADDSVLRVLLMNNLVVARFWSDPLERSLEVNGEALEMAERLDDPAAFVVTVCIRHALLLGPERASERRELGEEAVRRALASGQRGLELSARAIHTGQLVESADSAALDLELAAIGRLTDEMDHSFSMLARVSRSLLCGDLPAAEKVLGLAMNDPGLELRNLPVPPAFCGLLAALRREQGRLGELEPALRATVGLTPGVPLWRALLALALLETGRTDEARRELDDLAEGDFKDLPHTGLWLGTTVLLGELCARLGDKRRAALLYEELLPFEDRVAVVADFLYAGPVAHALGLLAGALGRRREAERHLAVALERAEALQARPLIARIRIECAELALAGRARRRARRHLVEGARLARELGLGRVVAAAGTLEREL